jgi:hypothetical protein
MNEYRIFHAVSKEDSGYEKVADAITDQINAAMEDYDIEFIGGPSFRDDPASRGVYFGDQATILTRKKK